jgi:hypothetical protein
MYFPFRERVVYGWPVCASTAVMPLTSTGRSSREKLWGFATLPTPLTEVYAIIQSIGM